jgi:PDZ domain
VLGVGTKHLRTVLLWGAAILVSVGPTSFQATAASSKQTASKAAPPRAKSEPASQRPLLSPNEAEIALRANPDLKARGLYETENQLTFNVLDYITYDAATDDVALIGHQDDRYKGPRISYLQHLGNFLENERPRFTLTWTKESERRVDAFLNGKDQGAKLPPYFAKIFNETGQVTDIGRRLLPSFDISVVSAFKPPGFIGLDVEQSPGGALRVTRITPASPADQAGIKIGDLVTKVNGKVPFVPSEFQRTIRFAGSGNAVALTIGGRPSPILIELAADPDPDPWKYATRFDVEAALYREMGQADQAKAIEAVGIIDVLAGTAGLSEEVKNAAVHELADAIGLASQLGKLLPEVRAGRVDAATVNTEIGKRICRRLDELFKLEGNPTLTTFDSEQAFNVIDKLNVAIKKFRGAQKSTVDRLLDWGLAKSDGIQIPPSVVNELFGVRPEMYPEYLGVPGDSLLARAMFHGDYLGKQMTNRVNLKRKIPGYETDFEFDRKHPEFHRTESTFRLWISIEKLTVAQSDGGGTLRFSDAKMRFNIRELGPDLQDSSSKPGGYEELLTSLYDDLAQEYFTLHELREAAKLAAAAQWLHRKKPSLRFPSEGRVQWLGPNRVPGVVYIYLSPGAAAETIKPTILAMGGVSMDAANKVTFDNQGKLPVPEIRLGRTGPVDAQGRPVGGTVLTISPRGELVRPSAEQSPVTLMEDLLQSPEPLFPPYRPLPPKIDCADLSASAKQGSRLAKLSCSQLRAQLERDLEAERRQAEAARRATEEIEELKKESEEAQKEAVKAGFEALFAAYASDADKLAKSVSAYDGHITRLEHILRRKRNPQEIAILLQRLKDAYQKYHLASVGLTAKRVVDKLLKGKDLWEVEQEILRRQVENLAATNADVRALAADPKYASLFDDLGPDPYLAVAKAGIEQALEAIKNVDLEWAGKYGHLFGPAADFGEFLVQYGYNASKWTLAYKGILERNGVTEQSLQAFRCLKRQVEQTMHSLENKACKKTSAGN